MTLVECIMDMESRVDATFEKLRKELRSQFSEQQLAIIVTRNNFIPNTISYQAIEFEVKGSQTDRGFCLSFSALRYDPSKDSHTLSDDSVFILCDLSASSGEIITAMNIREIDTARIEDSMSLIDEVILFIEQQGETIRKGIESELQQPI